MTKILTSSLRCRLRSNPAATAPTRPILDGTLGKELGSFAGERGVRWQWLGDNSTRERSMLLPSFAIPFGDCTASGCRSSWSELDSKLDLIPTDSSSPPPPPHIQLLEVSGAAAA